MSKNTVFLLLFSGLTRQVTCQSNFTDNDGMMGNLTNTSAPTMAPTMAPTGAPTTNFVGQECDYLLNHTYGVMYGGDETIQTAQNGACSCFRNPITELWTVNCDLGYCQECHNDICLTRIDNYNYGETPNYTNPEYVEYNQRLFFEGPLPYITEAGDTDTYTEVRLSQTSNDGFYRCEVLLIAREAEDKLACTCTEVGCDDGSIALAFFCGEGERWANCPPGASIEEGTPSPDEIAFAELLSAQAFNATLGNLTDINSTLANTTDDVFFDGDGMEDEPFDPDEFEIDNPLVAINTKVFNWTVCFDGGGWEPSTAAPGGRPERPQQGEGDVRPVPDDDFEPS